MQTITDNNDVLSVHILKFMSPSLHLQSANDVIFVTKLLSF